MRQVRFTIFIAVLAIIIVTVLRWHEPALEYFCDHVDCHSLKDAITNSVLFKRGGLSIARTSTKTRGIPTKGQVCVIGGGLAGVSAALEASRIARDFPDMEVILFEKTAKIGGNSQKASSGINGQFSSAQVASGALDTYDLFFEDTNRAGAHFGHVELIHRLISESKSAIEFLESFNIPFEKVANLGGHSAARTHRPTLLPGMRPMGAGAQIMYQLGEALRSDEKIQLIVNASISSIERAVRRPGAYLLTYSTKDEPEPVQKHCSRVILTTGGYAQNEKLLQDVRPDLVGLPSTNGEWSTGDGLEYATSLGAKQIQLSHIQVHPTSFVDPKNPQSLSNVLAAEALRGVGGILLDHHGRRFTNELLQRARVSENIFSSCGPYRGGEGNPRSAWLVLSEAMAKEFGPNFAFYHKVRGFFTKFTNVKEAAEHIGVSVEVLQDTLTDYATSDEGDFQFGRYPNRNYETFNNLEEGFYIGAITPAIHYTMGGIAIDDFGRVLDQSGLPMKNLFAAGEVTGGMHGKDRLGGNSLLECVVMGRIAAATALNVHEEMYPRLSEPSITELDKDDSALRLGLDTENAHLYASFVPESDSDIAHLIRTLREHPTRFPKPCVFPMGASTLTEMTPTHYPEIESECKTIVEIDTRSISGFQPSYRRSETAVSSGELFKNLFLDMEINLVLPSINRAIPFSSPHSTVGGALVRALNSGFEEVCQRIEEEKLSFRLIDMYGEIREMNGPELCKHWHEGYVIVQVYAPGAVDPDADDAPFNYDAVMISLSNEEVLLDALNAVPKNLFAAYGLSSELVNEMLMNRPDFILPNSASIALIGTIEDVRAAIETIKATIGENSIVHTISDIPYEVIDVVGNVTLRYIVREAAIRDLADERKELADSLVAACVDATLPSSSHIPNFWLGAAKAIGRGDIWYYDAITGIFETCTVINEGSGTATKRHIDHSSRFLRDFRLQNKLGPEFCDGVTGRMSWRKVECMGDDLDLMEVPTEEESLGVIAIE